MALTVVIPTRDRSQLLEGCLARLAPTLRQDDEVIVVDSASVGSGTAAVAQRHGARVVRSEMGGVSLARNLGAVEARHALIAFVDDDVRVREGWLNAAEEALGDVAFVVARISAPSGQVADRPVAIRDDAQRREITPDVEPLFEASACFAIRGDAFASVGGFDERLGPGRWYAAAEDLDLFDRLRRAGVHGRYEPTMHVEHDQWRTRRDLLSLEWNYGKGMGAYLALVAQRSPRDARRQARSVLWSDGLRKIPAAIRVRFEFAVLCELLRFTATVLAFTAACVTLRGSA